MRLIQEKTRKTSPLASKNRTRLNGDMTKDKRVTPNNKSATKKKERGIFSLSNARLMAKKTRALPKSPCNKTSRKGMPKIAPVLNNNFFVGRLSSADAQNEAKASEVVILANSDFD